MRAVWVPQLVINVNKVKRKLKVEVGQKTCLGSKEELKNDFFKAEAMGVEHPGCCKKPYNKSCPDCSFRVWANSENDVLEYRMLKQGVQYNDEG